MPRMARPCNLPRYSRGRQSARGPRSTGDHPVAGRIPHGHSRRVRIRLKDPRWAAAALLSGMDELPVGAAADAGVRKCAWVPSTVCDCWPTRTRPGRYRRTGLPNRRRQATRCTRGTSRLHCMMTPSGCCFCVPRVVCWAELVSRWPYALKGLPIEGQLTTSLESTSRKLPFTHDVLQEKVGAKAGDRNEQI